MNITNYYQNAYTFVPTYRDEYTAYHRHMISVVVFLYSNTHKRMLIGYAVTYMGFFDGYSDVAPRSKTIRLNGITDFLLRISRCITFHQIKLFTATLIPEA